MKTQSKPAVLFISSEFPPNVGGIGNHAFSVAKYLASNGFNVHVLADLMDVEEQKLKEFQSTISFRLHPVLRSKVVIMTYLQRIQKAIALSRKADVIICSGKFQLWLVLILKSILSNKKYIAVVHGSELDLKQQWAKNLTDKSLTKFDEIISVSNFTATLLPQDVKAKNITTVVHNGINNSEFVSSEPAKLKGEPAIITVGSVTERKGQVNVINALPSLLKTYPQLHYHIVGKPVIKEELEALANDLNVTGHITFHGIVSRAELVNNIAGSTVKMMLSNYTADGDFEGFGIGIIEANALAKPAIGSKLGGIPDAVKDGVTGKLVDPKNAEEVTDALKQIMQDYPSFSTNALQWAKDHDWDILIHQYINVINKACNA